MPTLQAQHIDAARLAAELAARWLPQLAKNDWSERLRLLDRIHEQLQDDLNDLQLYSEVSPFFVRDVIRLLGGGPITCEAQAHVYANSADGAHRNAAGDWLARKFGRPS